MDQSVVWGAPPAERADAARNRLHLLTTAREMLAEQGQDRLTMDGLAQRAGLGKGTVFRRFGTRAGIFQALLDDDELTFQQGVLSGPPPLGPGAPPLERLIAYGRARAGFMVGHREIARAALDGSQPVPVGHRTPMSQVHIRVLLGQLSLDGVDLDMLTVQRAVGGFEAELLELVPDERIVFRWGFVGPDRDAGPAFDSLLTVTLHEAPGGGTRLILVHERVDELAAAMRDVAKQVGTGWDSVLDQMAVVVKA